MSVNATLAVRLDFAQSGAADFAPARFAGAVEAILAITNGTGVQQADLLFVDERTVNASTNDDLDLAGVLSSAFGQVITAVEVVAILLVNRAIDPQHAANLSSLTLGGATNPVAGLAAGPIGPGGIVLLADPDAGGLATVVAATGDMLRIANGAGGAAVYQIAILARSA